MPKRLPNRDSSTFGCDSEVVGSQISEKQKQKKNPRMMPTNTKDVRSSRTWELSQLDAWSMSLARQSHSNKLELHSNIEMIVLIIINHH
jgi:hypothetical protein